MGSKNQYQYIKGSDYIGETIHITVKSGNNDEKKDYNFKVKGTFDNIRSMADGNIFCLSEEDALDIYQYYGLTGLDEFIEGIRQEYPNQLESFYDALNLQFNMAITVKSGYDFNAAGKMLREKFEGPSYVSTFFHEDANGISYMEFLIFLSDIMSFLIAIAASVSMVLMFIADMRRRKYDFALRYSMGYTAARQILLYGENDYFYEGSHHFSLYYCYMRCRRKLYDTKYCSFLSSEYCAVIGLDNNRYHFCHSIDIM